MGEPLRINVRSAPPAYLGERYEARFPASGGVRPYRYELEGKLPQGLNFANGRLSGVPREKGSFKITVVVSDAALSSRSASFVLKVSDPPPPALKIKLPQSETDAPFIAVFTLTKRPASALRLSLAVKDLKPDLASFKAAPGLVYVLRYDAKRQTLDLDGAFPQTFKGGEVFRLKFEPVRKLRPRVQTQTQFFNAKGEPYTKTPPKRPADEGRYGFDDLRALAAAWGKKPAAKAPPEAGTGSADKEAAAKSETSASAKKETRTGTEPSGSGAGEPPNEASAMEGPASPAPEAVSEESTKDSPATQVDAANAKPAAPAARFDPDLNTDGVVNTADLELLRKDYAFNPGGRLGTPTTNKTPEKGEEAGGETNRAKENPAPEEAEQAP